jgi:hypothetical protein
MFRPASKLADAKWPLAWLVAEGKVVNTNTPEFINYASRRRPPAPLGFKPTGPPR